MSRLDFQRRAPNGKLETVGYMDLQNSSDKAVLSFYGDIVGDSWGAWSYDDKYPSVVSDFFKDIDSNSPVEIHFNSCGGDVFAGIAIYNIIQRHQGEKTGYVDGLAASIASVILCACDKVYMCTGSQVMIHKPWTWGYGNADDFQNIAEQLNLAEESILDIYENHTAENVTREDLATAMRDETWLTTNTVGDYFDFEVDNATLLQNIAASTYMDHYKNVPRNLVGKQTSDDEDRKKKIVEDLYLYGTQN